MSIAALIATVSLLLLLLLLLASTAVAAARSAAVRPQKRRRRRRDSCLGATRLLYSTIRFTAYARLLITVDSCLRVAAVDE